MFILFKPWQYGLSMGCKIIITQLRSLPLMFVYCLFCMPDTMIYYVIFSGKTC